MSARSRCCPLCAVNAVLRFFRARSAGVAVIVALSAPILIAVTGLSVDIGYWFQNQTSLQSAADSAALGAAMNDTRLGQTTAAAKASYSMPYAQAAADSATHSQFNFASASTNPAISVTCCTAPGTALGIYTGTTTYTATVHAPRPGFLSQISGSGLIGLPAGTQYASATATLNSSSLVSGQSCLFVNPQHGTGAGITQIVDNGGGSAGGISASNCSITVNCSGAGDTAFSPPSSANSSISAQNITVASASGCTAVSGGDYSNLYTNANETSATATGPNGVVSTTVTAPDPLASMGDALGDQTSGSAAWQTACSNAGFTSSSTSPVTLPSPDIVNGTTYRPTGTCEPLNAAGPFTSGGTYYFPYGLNVNTNTSTFGPGIYYFGGPGLSASGGLTVTSNEATLVFVGSATITMSGNGNGNNGDKVALVAPDPSIAASANCLPPTEYNNASTPAADAASLDGTNGAGICGIAVYQGRNDQTAMVLEGDTASTVIGIIYAPKAQLTLSGNGGFSYGTYSSSVGTLDNQKGTFGLMVNNVVLNGNGNLAMNLNTNDSAGATVNSTQTTTVSTSPPFLTN
jgi:Flp pilus assembly protein TadG